MISFNKELVLVAAGWESVTNPLDKLLEDWFFLGIARFSGLRTIQIRSPERYFWHFSGSTKEILKAEQTLAL